MNQLFAAGAAFVLAVTLLGFGKKPKNPFNTKVSESLPLSYSSLVVSSKKAREQKTTIDLVEFEFPATAREKFYLLQKLRELILSGPEERLLAVKMADKWSDIAVLPILRLGLRDFDSRVVIKSAEVISRFRGCPKLVQNKKSQTHPRNVSLIL